MRSCTRRDPGSIHQAERKADPNTSSALYTLYSKSLEDVYPLLGSSSLFRDVVHAGNVLYVILVE